MSFYQKLLYPKIRNQFMSLGFILLFFLSWVADAIPELASATIGAGILIILAQIFALYASARGVNTTDRITESSTAAGADSNSLEYEKKSINHSAYVKLIEAASNNIIKTEEVFHTGQILTRSEQIDMFQTRLMHAHRISSLIERQLVERARNDRRKLIPMERAGFNIEPNGNDAFTITAGAFAIEYFHGKSLIRVVDESKVSVEGDKRGQRYSGQSEEFQPSKWH